MQAESTRRNDIREAALSTFAERGYHGTGMEDIAAVVGIRASSLYNHVRSKQDVLADIMITTMRDLSAGFDAAAAAGAGPAEQLQLAMVAHVNYHATHRRDVRIGNREIPSLEEPARSLVMSLRHDYAVAWQNLIERGVAEGRFRAQSPQLSAYALLEMGIGVSQWYREDGPLSLAEVAAQYGEMALRLVGAG